jgi:hypothetical protein
MGGGSDPGGVKRTYLPPSTGESELRIYLIAESRPADGNEQSCCDRLARREITTWEGHFAGLLTALSRLNLDRWCMCLPEDFRVGAADVVGVKL